MAFGICAKLSIMPTLYIVATPIGNLEDISFRAVRILKEVSLIASEDTRTTRHLLTHFDIHTPLTSYYEHNKSTKLDYLLGKLAQGDVALVSEAGMPAISDPGYELVVAAQQKDIPVVAIPGASAAITALAVAGLPTDQFHYLGYMPRKAGERRKLLEAVAKETVTLVVYESPHRLVEALHDIMSVLGNRRMAVCRELTKLYEEVFRGTVEQAISHFGAPRGEFTLVIEGFKVSSAPVEKTEIIEKLKQMRSSGMVARDATAQLAAESGMSRRELYRIWLMTK
jgi:16S rRNA (cytidine1402-2'-O)-methyltransferase